MKKRGLLVACAMILALGSAHAGIDLNEVGAFLVYPGVAASAGGPPCQQAPGAQIETFLTVTNTSAESVIAHVSFINGNRWDPQYCYECDFDVPLTGLDTDTLVLTRQDGVTIIENLDSGARRSCSQSVGFVTVDVEDADHHVLSDNILLGSEVVVNYTSGTADSVPAISIQGDGDGGDRSFSFDGKEYRKFPAIVGTDFIAPDHGCGVDANLILFTLAFERQFPPLTDCSVIGLDAFESQFSSSFQFGCWTMESLLDLDPEFAFPFLGALHERQEHGWLQLSCTVFGTGGNGVVQGGVHGAITQYVPAGIAIRRNDPGPWVNDAASWSRLLFQSSTVGDALSLHLESPAHGGGF
jgi:hypothetical protein